MQKSEIAAGLKSAIQRGESLEQAKQSFINAGYNKADIEDSAKLLGGVISEMPITQATSQIQQTTKLQPMTAQQQYRKLPQQEKVKKGISKALVIILAVILLLSLGVLLSIIFFKEKVIDFVNNLW